MRRVRNRLTALQVESVKPADFKGGKGGLLADGGGLYLNVDKPGNKSWIFRYKRHGRKTPRDHGLGPYPVVKLARARDLALQCERILRDGVDPIDAKRAERQRAKIEAAQAITFKQCTERYIASHKAGWSNSKHAAQWSGSMEAFVFPVIGNLPVQAIDTALVMKVLEQDVKYTPDSAANPFWVARPETASRVRGRIESVLDFATAREWRQGENPARWRGHLENLLAKRSKVRSVKHLAALPYAEISTFMRKLRQQKGVGARALEFVVLTAVRTSEAIGARWDEINFAERVWTIPAERMKARKEHRVPLSDAAVAILRQMQEIRQNDHVFPGSKARRPINDKAMAWVLRRLAHDNTTVHGLRSTFRDWAAEQSSFPYEVCEMALGHAVASAVERAYRRGDLFAKRKLLMQAWGRYCSARAAAAEVVELAAAR